VEELTDEFLNIHKIDTVLGQGGQGIVHRTKDPDIAIKRVVDEEGKFIKDEAFIKKYHQQIKNIKYLPFPSNINIATPIALLYDSAGYVMQLLTEMIPFESFWSDANSLKKIEKEDIPLWLPLVPKALDIEKLQNIKKLDKILETTLFSMKEIVYYKNTGGLKIRLKALYNASEILARLHSQGLVYGDISPGNIFISQNKANIQSWFIDPDNLKFYLTSSKGGVYTPKYGAPELVQGVTGSGYRTDCHAFATMAFYLLSMIHPFIGEKVLNNDEGWEDTDENEPDMDEKAYAGYFSWVDDREDNSNQNSSGLPRTLLLTKKIEDLFDNTFSKGRVNPSHRPSIFHWTEALAEAHDKTVVCQACQMSWFYDIEGNICPYCHVKKPKSLLLNTFILKENKKLNSPIWTYVQGLKEEELLIEIPQRVFSPFYLQTHDNSYITIEILEDIIEIRKEESIAENIFIAIANIDNGEFKELVSGMVMKREDWKDILYIYIDGIFPRVVECRYGVQL